MYTADELEIRAALAGSPRADELIACLEGEIAERDARIVELEADLAGTQSRVLVLQGQWRQIDAELAAIKEQEPTGWYTEDHLDDKSATTYSWAVAERWVEKGWPVSPLYAAPVSEAKAQGVVIPAELDRAFITGESCDGVYRVVIQSEKLKEMQAVHSWLTSLNAAPAAPAADAGLVEALKQAFPLFDEDGLNELYHHCEIAVLGDRKRLHKLLATHSAKGVV